ncbi:MAG: VOC family protein [Phycisphaerae bacterium]|jgi:catechol 2,3-dioxygenase-like lactoylglutathione lyase family enzyme|nr:VOC family protein [Phycisphaerae bacterium]
MDQTPEFSHEHTALNVPDFEQAARWYCRNLGMQVLRSGETVRFLSDSTGRLIFEFYTNSDELIPDYAQMAPATLHLAFCVSDVPAAVAKLTAAGATIFSDYEVAESGDEMAMLRDPWGVPLQLMKRAEAM